MMNVLFLTYANRTVWLLGECELETLDGIFCMVIELAAVKSLAVDTCLEVAMLGSGTSRTSRESYRMTSLDPLSFLDEVLGLMAVESLKSVGMTDDDGIAVCVVYLRHDYLAWESSIYGVVRTCLDVCTGMTAFASVWAYYLGTRERVVPLCVCEFIEVYGKLISLRERIDDILFLQLLPLVYIRLCGICILCMECGTYCHCHGCSNDCLYLHWL